MASGLYPSGTCRREQCLPWARRQSFTIGHLMSTAPLAGLRVIEFSAFVAAPSAGLALAQLGAEVIRIDPLGGNIDIERAPLGPTGRSLYWASLNRGKKSVELDVRSAEGRALMQRLICSRRPAGVPDQPVGGR